MAKPNHLSNKKWNKKFQKNVKKFQQLSSVSNEERIGKSAHGSHNSLTRFGLLKNWAIFEYLLGFIKVVPVAISQIFVKLSSTFSKANHSKTLETDTALLEARVNSLEKTLQECAERMKSLQQEVEQSKMQPKPCNSSQFTSNEPTSALSNRMPGSSIAVTNHSMIPVPPQALIPPPPPPPPPPPLPPMNFPTMNNRLISKKLPSPKKTSQKSQSRPAISVEDILSVRLKKTPSISKTERVIPTLLSVNNFYFNQDFFL